jgi:uncharacterized coiled-coil DUF342 family protein
MLPPDPSGEPMCAECFKLDQQIARYREFIKLGFETEDRIRKAIDEFEQQMVELHASEDSH